MKFNELWKDMTPAERMIQNECYFTLGWMNQFVQEEVRIGMLRIANRCLYLQKEVRRLKKELSAEKKSC